MPSAPLTHRQFLSDYRRCPLLGNTLRFLERPWHPTGTVDPPPLADTFHTTLPAILPGHPELKGEWIYERHRGIAWSRILSRLIHAQEGQRHEIQGVFAGSERTHQAHWSSVLRFQSCEKSKASPFIWTRSPLGGLRPATRFCRARSFALVADDFLRTARHRGQYTLPRTCAVVCTSQPHSWQLTLTGRLSSHVLFILNRLAVGLLLIAHLSETFEGLRGP